MSSQWKPVVNFVVKDSLVVIMGIGDYHNVTQNLPGVGADYKRCVNVFNGIYNDCVFFQNTKNSNENVYSREKINLETAKISRSVKIEWKEDEIYQFFEDARDTVENNKHDALIVIISSHGDSDGVIIDSDGSEVSLSHLFYTFTRDECPYLKDKPKIVFVDACRGRMLSKVETTNVNNSSKESTKTQHPEITVKIKSPYVQSTSTAHTNENKDNNNDIAMSTSAAQPSIESQEKHKAESKKDININIETESENTNKYTNNTINSSETIEAKVNKNGFENKLKEQAYHREGNYRFIYASIDGYAVVEGGQKGGYLIRALHSVFSNVSAALSSNLDEIVYQINEQAKTRVGTNFVVQHIEDVNRMDGPVRFEIRQMKKTK